MDDDQGDVDRIRIPYSPRWFQREIHNNLKRFNVLVMHRRAGKTVLAVNELIKRIIHCPLADARGHYIAPYYRQVKRIAWKYCKEYTSAIPNMRYNESELRAIFPNGAEIELLGGDNYDALRGIYSDYAVLDEFAQMHPSTWGEVFRPALSDRKGGALFIGTPQGHNAFHKKWEQAGSLPGWYRAMYKVNETGALDRDEILAAIREMSKAEFDAEYMCSWSASIRGSYFGEVMQQFEEAGRIMSVPHDPGHTVQTSWDLGVSNLTVVHYWQTIGREARLIDCDAFQQTGMPVMAKKVLSKPYQYSQHIAPHDIAVLELGTGKTRLDTAAALGIVFDKAGRVSLEDGINATRQLIPRMVIDRENCSDSIEALRQYRTEYDDKLQIFKDKPKKDWTTDYCDSIRYYAVSDINTQISLWDKPLDYSREDKAAI